MKPETMVQNKIENLFTPFDYGTQRLSGRLGRAVDNNFNNGVMHVAYDDYLDAYKPGFPANWPSGEYLGKFMVALAKGFAYSGRPEALALMQRIVNTWVSSQQTDGYLGTSTLGYGVGPRWTDWAVWDHKYTLVGLLQFQALIGRGSAMECARRIGDLFAARCEEPGNTIVRANQGGLADGSLLEPMVDLYRMTGDRRHLEVCKRILQEFETEGRPRIVSELTERSGRVDKVGTAKGYEMLSCIIGILRMYQLTGEAVYLKTAQIAWDDISKYRLYITGTATSGEFFRDNHVLPATYDVRMGEACVTAHWIYLSRCLFGLTGDPKYVDAIELSVFNHLLTSQSPWTAYQSYYTPLIGKKSYGRPSLQSGEPPCCVSSAQRCIAETPEVIWARHKDNGLAILIYCPGTLDSTVRTAGGGEVGLKIEVRTEYPKSGQVEIDVRPARPVSFRLALRVPAWTSRFEVECGGAKAVRGEPGRFVEVEKEWRSGDTVKIDMDMTCRMLPGGPTYDGFHALKRGPMVLALGVDVNPGVDINTVRVVPTENPVLVPEEGKLPPNWLGGQAYTCGSVRAPDGRMPLLVPFADSGQMCNWHAYRVWIEAAK